MKPNISLASKKFPCFPPVETANPNPNPNRGQFSSGAIVRIPVKTKETKNQKKIIMIIMIEERKNK